MPYLAKLRPAANKLRQLAFDIRRENTPAPYAGAEEDIAMLENVSALLEQAADEIARLRAANSK
jgi:hypothetical protein